MRKDINDILSHTSTFIISLFLGLTTSFTCMIYGDIETNQSFSIGLLVFTFILFIDALGKKLPFREFIAFTGTLLWLVAPIAINKLYGLRGLFVEPDLYFSFSFPATFGMTIGLLIPLKKKLTDKQVLSMIKDYFNQPSKRKLQFIILITGFVGAILNNFSVPGISFFIYLISQLLYVGALYAILTPSISKVWVLSAVLAFAISFTIIGGMFGDLVWWGLVVLMILAMQQRYNFFKKLVIACIGLVFIIMIQNVKQLYRNEVWFAKPYQKKEQTLAFTESLEKTVGKSDLFSKKNLYPVLFRLNQAFFSSMVMRHVPDRQPFVNGETIILGSLGGFVPRFLWPDKPESGGKENMLRFAGYKLIGSTSIDIGNHMESYANFGWVGGIIFMFVYGLFLNWLFGAFMNLSKTISPTILLWSPFVFIQVLKVETSFSTTFNAAIKGIFFVLLAFWFFRRVLKIKL